MPVNRIAVTAKFLATIAEVVETVVVAFFGFGASTKPNAWPDQEAGYDPEGDKVYLGGQAVISTQDDTTNLQFRRRDNGPSVTGWADNTTIGRIGWIPVLKTGVEMFPGTGSDAEAGAIAVRLHLESNGDTIIGSYIQYLFQGLVDNDEDDENRLETLLEITGKGGLEAFLYRYAPDGTKTTINLAP